MLFMHNSRPNETSVVIKLSSTKFKVDKKSYLAEYVYESKNLSSDFPDMDNPSSITNRRAKLKTLYVMIVPKLIFLLDSKTELQTNKNITSNY